jgi:hypothetical protein
MYMRSVPIGAARWAVLRDSTQIAKVTLGRNGRCNASPTPHHAFSREDLEGLSTLMREIELD